MLRVPIAAALCLAILEACAGPTTLAPKVDPNAAASEAERQRELVARSMVEDQVRLSEVAQPVMTGGVPFCGDRLTTTGGVIALAPDAFEMQSRAAARRALAFSGDDGITVFGVASTGPAAEAGFQVRDEILAVAGHPVPRGEGASRALGDLFRSKAVAGQPMLVTIRRAGQEEDLQLVPRQACAFKLFIDPDQSINAFADGEAIHITQGMMRFATDEELAVVLAHELAHNAMGHLDKQRQNAVAGAGAGLLVDIVAAAAGWNTGGAFMRQGAEAGAMTFSKDFEAEADYVALYILANAGRPVQDAPYFWRRMATIDPQQIVYGTTHPTSPERFVAMDATAEEIETKLAAGEPLMPEYRPAAITEDDCQQAGNASGTAANAVDTDWSKVQECEAAKAAAEAGS